MAKVPHGVEILPKISIVWVGRTNVTDDRQTDRQTTDRRQTDRRWQIANMNLSSRSLKIEASSVCLLYHMHYRAFQSRIKNNHLPDMAQLELKYTGAESCWQCHLRDTNPFKTSVVIMVRSTWLRTQELPAHSAFICWRNEPYLPFPSQPKLVLMYQPLRDGRLSWPGWLVTYQNKCPAPGIEPGHGHPSQGPT